MATVLRSITFLFPARPAPKPRAVMAGGSSSSPSPLPLQRKLPILLFDVMDTIVRDPFYHDVPVFFKMPMKELLETKHPTAWAEFEMGLIDECKLAKIFFKDGRSFDLEGLKECMMNGYSYIDGIEALLHGLKENHYELHAFTNYPIWYKMIEEKLKLSKYLSWTFCSCIIGKRKPAADSYMEVLHRLGVEPANCIFIDDRIRAWTRQLVLVLGGGLCIIWTTYMFLLFLLLLFMLLLLLHIMSSYDIDAGVTHHIRDSSYSPSLVFLVTSLSV